MGDLYLLLKKVCPSRYTLAQLSVLLLAGSVMYMRLYNMERQRVKRAKLRTFILCFQPCILIERDQKLTIWHCWEILLHLKSQAHPPKKYVHLKFSDGPTNPPSPPTYIVCLLVHDGDDDDDDDTKRKPYFQKYIMKDVWIGSIDRLISRYFCNREASHL